ASGPAGRGPAGRRPGGRGPGREPGRDREPSWERYAGRESFPDGAPRQAGPPGAVGYDQAAPAPPRRPGRARGLPPDGTGEPPGPGRSARSAPRAMMAGPGELSSRGKPSGRGSRKGLKRSRVWLLLGGSGPAHALITPAKLGAYVRKPQLEQQMNAKQLQQQVVAKSAGQASDVVDAVYEANSASADGTSPQVILFI